MLLRTRLTLMICLQYIVWGAWIVTLSSYTATALRAAGGPMFSDELIGQAYCTSAIAAMMLGRFVAGHATLNAMIGHDRRSIGLAPAAMATFVLIVLALAFCDSGEEATVDESPLPSRAPTA